jgi:hypothetical protein
MADKNSYTPESLISLGREIVSQHISHFLDVVQQRVFGPLKNLFQYAREQEWKQFESIWLRAMPAIGLMARTTGYTCLKCGPDPPSLGLPAPLHLCGLWSLDLVWEGTL